MKKMRLLGIFCVLAIACFQVHAGNDTKTGTAGAMEVLLPVGARGTAMAGANASLGDGVEAIHWNPAGLASGWGQSNVEVMFSHMQYIADTKLEYAAVGLGLGDFGIIGLTLRSFNWGDIQETTEVLPDGTGRTFTPQYLTVGLTYAKSLTDRIHIGFTGKYISESILRTSATGFAMDAGVIYNVGGAGLLQGLRFGVALKNIGPSMQFSGADLERSVVPPNSAPGAVATPLAFTAQSFELPSTFDVGVGYDYKPQESHRLSANVQFENQNFGTDRYRLGAEYAFNEMFFLRGGYETNDGTKSDFVFGGTFGAGVRLDVGGVAVIVDYAYMTTRVFSGVNVISVRLAM